MVLQPGTSGNSSFTSGNICATPGWRAENLLPVCRPYTAIVFTIQNGAPGYMARTDGDSSAQRRAGNCQPPLAGVDNPLTCAGPIGDRIGGR